MSLFLLVLLFIACQIYLEKGKLPPRLKEAKLRYILLGSIGIITLLLPVAAFLPMGITIMIAAIIMMSSIIAYKYRQKFEDMERGKRV